MQKERGQEWISDFYEKLEATGLVKDLEKCMACGKCVGGCPAAALTETYNSRRIIRDVLFGNAARLLSGEEIWQCFWCKTCYVSCPHDVDPAMLILALRFQALARGYGARYAAGFKRFAERLYQYGLSFVPGEKRMERIREGREKLDLPPLVLEEKALEELRVIFEATGAKEWISGLDAREDRPLELAYAKGRTAG
ncbi:MAG: 4Fe-4S binding protein [Firmicutes bacterium]|nr:4Fe-4S binding protein [Bacillota bacterium]